MYAFFTSPSRSIFIIAARALQPLGSNPLLLQEVAYHSESLLDLYREFVESSKDKLREVNFFEARKTRLIKAWFIQWEEFVSLSAIR